MCGIYGMVGGNPADVLPRMSAALVHRGPDGDGAARRGFGALGCRRLAIVDVAGGAQPVANESGDVIAVCNGEIYNHAALRADLARRFPRARLVAGDPDFEATVTRVVACVETPRLGLDLPLDVRGTAFQHRVWRALRDIPAGTTATYSEIARRIGAPRAVRAVAGACAANPLAVAIPCHRVVRNDGELAGYRWGLPRKRALLARESRK